MKRRNLLTMAGGALLAGTTRLFGWVSGRKVYRSELICCDPSRVPETRTMVLLGEMNAVVRKAGVEMPHHVTYLQGDAGTSLEETLALSVQNALTSNYPARRLNFTWVLEPIDRAKKPLGFLGRFVLTVG